MTSTRSGLSSSKYEPNGTFEGGLVAIGYVPDFAHVGDGGFKLDYGDLRRFN